MDSKLEREKAEKNNSNEQSGINKIIIEFEDGTTKEYESALIVGCEDHGENEMAVAVGVLNFNNKKMRLGLLSLLQMLDEV